ncbi:MAG: hypothetical protein IJG38_04970 [Thermoguttaceae bacterium]|nr:hypothetical protein [Thermoguttaceae bacterium]
MNDEKNAVFTDAKGDSWRIAITFGDIMRVKNHVIGIDGKPLDLCYIAETGDFRQVTEHIEIVVKCVYWLLYNDIKEIADGDTANWFYARIDETVLPDLVKAWYEAIVNFTPSPVVKAAMITAGQTKTEAQILAAIEILAGQLKTFTNTPEYSELTPKDTATVN